MLCSCGLLAGRDQVHFRVGGRGIARASRVLVPPTGGERCWAAGSPPEQSSPPEAGALVGRYSGIRKRRSSRHTDRRSFCLRDRAAARASQRPPTTALRRSVPRGTKGMVRCHAPDTRRGARSIRDVSLFARDNHRMKDVILPNSLLVSNFRLYPNQLPNRDPFTVLEIPNDE